MIVELRSDTFTHPTPAMRAAMATAEVGDDVFGEDPTIHRLEAMAATRVGKEAALFVPSGTMGNLAAIMAWCQRGDEVILGDQGHTFIYEAGGSAVAASVHPRALVNRPDGTLDPGDVEAAVRPLNDHFPTTRLILLENTHNRCGGRALRPAYLAAIRALADKHDLQIHMDGARLFNGAVALGLDPRELTRYVDSVTFCVSKGLAAPVGSLLCGPADFVSRARRARKLLGGGMRQAGILAAAGIVALETMVDRLADDHANAKRLAEGLARLPGITVDPTTIETNIVYFGLDHPRHDAQSLVALLRAEDVRVLAVGPSQLRAVTHYEVSATGVERAIEAARGILGSGNLDR